MKGTQHKQATLSKRQHAILNAICRYMDSRQYAPVNREIGELVGVKSTSVIDYELEALIGYGIIDRTKSQARTITVNASACRRFGVTPPLVAVLLEDFYAQQEKAS